MGVRRLQTFLERYCPEACYEVDIQEIANEYRQKYNRDPVIVVDGSGCHTKLYGKMDWICGGQFKEFSDIINFFFDSFERVGIKLIMFFDGATQEGKRSVWVKRRLDSMYHAHEVIDALKTGVEVEAVPSDKFLLPAGAGNVMTAMAKERCEVQRSLIECDEEISHYAEKNNCLAILAQDTDFVIYENRTHYYLSLAHLNLNTMRTVVYDRVALAQDLQIEVCDLPVLATLMGNDVISADDLKPFHGRLIRGHHKEYVSLLVRAIARFIQKLPKGNDLMSQLSQLSRDLFRTPRRAEELRKSILCYGKSFKNNTRSADPRSETWDKIMSVAHCNYVSMEAPSFVYNILRKLPFEMSTALEDCRIEVPPSAVALRQMRRRCYGVLLREYPDQSEIRSTVEEWCTSGPQSLNSALKVTAIFPPDESPCLLDLWLSKSDELNEERFKLLGWISSGHLSSIKLSTFPQNIIAPICILSYLYHDAGILESWEVNIFAAVVVDTQALDSQELSKICVGRVNVRGVQLATLFTRAITHLLQANSVCGNPVQKKWTIHPQLFDGRLFQNMYLKGENFPAAPKHGNLQHYNQICESILSQQQERCNHI